MNLKESRDKLRDYFEAGGELDNHIMRDYVKYRDTEDWRSTHLFEEMAEYILHLERKLNKDNCCGRFKP